MTDPESAQPRHTPLTAVHERLGATLTDFAGWLMPLRYGSEQAEHRAVRASAGLFDLSHMGEITVTGPDAAAMLDYALVGDLSALAPGRARYTMICAPDGGVLDDLIVYRLSGEKFLVVANAANTAAVHAALLDRAGGQAAVVADETADYALIAVQGPRAAGILGALTSARLADVRYYAGQSAEVAGCAVMLARTGYTGEDGFELFARPGDAERLWAALTEAGSGAGLVPAGLAARDTLRLEAGMPLYGNELGPDVTPFDAGLGRVVKFGKPGDFVGRSALAERAQAAPDLPASRGGCPGTGIRCSGTGAPAEPSPAAPRHRRSACRSRWRTSTRTWRGRRTAGTGRAGSPWTSGAAPSLPSWYRSRSTAAQPDPPGPPSPPNSQMRGKHDRSSRTELHRRARVGGPRWRHGLCRHH